jgi:hypothetical protein
MIGGFIHSFGPISCRISTYLKHPLWSLRCADQVMIGLDIEGLEGDDRGCPNVSKSPTCSSNDLAENPKKDKLDLIYLRS